MGNQKTAANYIAFTAHNINDGLYRQAY